MVSFIDDLAGKGAGRPAVEKDRLDRVLGFAAVALCHDLSDGWWRGAGV
jgi:hypothetical protein